MPKMPMAAICKGKWSGGEIGVERDQGLRRQPLNSPLCNLQKHVSRWSVVPGEGLMQIRGLEASQTHNKAVCLSYTGYSMKTQEREGKEEGWAEARAVLPEKEIPDIAGCWWSIISAPAWPHPETLLRVSAGTSGLLGRLPVFLPRFTPSRSSHTKDYILITVAGSLPITALPCVPLWFATFKGHEEMHSEAAFKSEVTLVWVPTEACSLAVTAEHSWADGGICPIKHLILCQ